MTTIPLRIALTDGTNTRVLTDGVRFSVDAEAGWKPTVALDQDTDTVFETITVNVLGATAALVRKNQSDLTAILRQVQRGQDGDGGIVTLEVTTPNSSPGRVLSAQVLEWTPPEGYLPAINDAPNLITGSIEQVTVLITHRAPWQLKSYVTTNLITDSIWSAAAPVWTSGSYTMTNAAFNGYYGGRRYGQASAGSDTINGTFYSTSSNNAIVCTLNVPIAFDISYGASAGVSNLRIQLVNSAGAVRSNQATVTIITPAATTADAYRTARVTLTPNATGTFYPHFTVDITAGGVLQVAEPWAVLTTTAEDAHHPTLAEASVVATGTVTFGAVQTITWGPDTDTIAPVDVAITGIGTVYGNTFPDGLAQTLMVINSGTIGVMNLPDGSVSAPFTSVGDSGKAALSTNVLQYTPTVANTWSSIAFSTFLTDYITATKRWGAYLVCRNNSLTATFQLQLRGILQTASLRTAEADIVLVKPYTTQKQPIIVPLGTLESNVVFRDMLLRVQSNITGQTLDMDRIVFVEMRDDTSVIITDAVTNAAGIPDRMDYLSDWLSGATPYIRMFRTGTGLLEYKVDTQDDPLLRHRGQTMRLYWDGCSGPCGTGTGGFWRLITATTPTVVTPAFTVTRLPTYDHPI